MGAMIMPARPLRNHDAARRPGGLQPACSTIESMRHFTPGHANRGATSIGWTDVPAHDDRVASGPGIIGPRCVGPHKENKSMFSWFERRLPTFPLEDPVTPPRGFFSFVWACTKGARSWILLIALTSAALAAYEAALFAMMGRVVDWLASSTPADFGGRHFGTLAGFAAILAGSALLIALHTMVKRCSRSTSRCGCAGCFTG